MYLDYAAAGLYTNTQIDAHAEDLKEQLYGNPHSLSTLASCSTVVYRSLGEQEAVAIC